MNLYASPEWQQTKYELNTRYQFYRKPRALLFRMQQNEYPEFLIKEIINEFLPLIQQLLKGNKPYLWETIKEKYDNIEKRRLLWKYGEKS